MVRLVVLSIVWFVVAAAVANGGRVQVGAGSRRRLTLGQTRGRVDCYVFTRMFNMLTFDGDLFISGGNNVTADRCQDLCLSHFHAQVCIAANHRHGGQCVLAGYKLYPKYGATHYRRLCRKGRSCFSPYEGMETHFHTGVIYVPPLVGASDFVAADICRRECEELVFCVGFDLHQGGRYCPYTEIRPMRNLYFTLYLRSC